MNTSTAVYATLVMTVVAEEDGSRAIWPSCPAIGWTTGVHMLDATPNGKTLTTPDTGARIETHGPYQHGTTRMSGFRSRPPLFPRRSAARALSGSAGSPNRWAVRRRPSYCEQSTAESMNPLGLQGTGNMSLFCLAATRRGTPSWCSRPARRADRQVACTRASRR